MKIVYRSDWGAQPARGKFRALNPRKVQGIVLHHSGVLNPPKGVAAVKAYEAYQLSKPAYTGIAYGWLVDEQGVIYEGRPIGMATGATRGWNSRTESICYTGFGGRDVPPEALQSIKDLVAHIQKRYDNKLWVKPHRDLGQTTCPGDVLSNWLVGGMKIEGDLPLSLDKGDRLAELAKEVAHRPLSRKRRSRGEAGRAVQTRLKERGHDPGKIDGVMGKVTAYRTRRFQRQMQYLKVDGVVGVRTWNAVFDA